MQNARRYNVKRYTCYKINAKYQFTKQQTALRIEYKCAVIKCCET